MNRHKPIVSKVQEEEDFDISALASIIKNCNIFMSDGKFQKHWNDCNVILKECRNELNHAVIQNSSPTKYKNFMAVKGNLQTWLKEIADTLDPNCDEMRFFKMFSNHSLLEFQNYQ